MLIGRLVGWLLIGLAIVLVSGEAVMALGTGGHDGIAAGEMVTLLSGYATEGAGADFPPLQAVGAFVSGLPAWAVLAPVGACVCWFCRRRPKRFRFRPA